MIDKGVKNFMKT